MTAWTDLSAAFAYGTKLTSTQMQQLRDNIAAAFEKAAGAPVLANDYVVTAMVGADQLDSQHYAAGSIDQEHIAANAVGQSQLKESSGSVSTTSDVYVHLTLPGGAYGLYPQIKISNALGDVFAEIGLGVSETSYITNIDLKTDNSSYTAYAQQYYVTASGEIHWIFILADRATGKYISTFQAPDHVCFGNRGAQHPFPGYDPSKHEILVVNPDMADVYDIMLRRIPSNDGGYMTPEKLQNMIEEDWIRGEKDFMEVFLENFGIDEIGQADWPDTDITVGLPRTHNGQLVSDWRFMPLFGPDREPLLIQPVKAVVKRPDYITPLKYRRKIAQARS